MNTPFNIRCNCPDFTKAAPKNPNSIYLNENINRDWSHSNAGLDPNQLCKHGWAAIMSAGLLEQVGVPNDPKIDRISLPKKQGVERLQSNTNRGHYFGV